MCLISFQWQPNAERKLILSANRDEFFQRPAQELHPWQDQPGVIAGKDLSQGGTWLGIHNNGRFAALTNHRDLRDESKKKVPAKPISRGKLVIDFLTAQLSPLDYLKQLEKTAQQYDGYNLIVADGHSLAYFSNRSEQAPMVLPAGLYGLSNGLLQTPWPKLISAKQKLATWIDTDEKTKAPLAGLLSSTEIASDDTLPNTGIGLAMERVLSSEKIITPNYGTRCSTGLIISQEGISIEEVSWNPDGSESGRKQYVIRY